MVSESKVSQLVAGTGLIVGCPRPDFVGDGQRAATSSSTLALYVRRHVGGTSDVNVRRLTDSDLQSPVDGLVDHYY